MTPHLYLACFRKEADGAFSVTFPDVEGAISQGADFAEAYANAKDALDSYLGSLIEDGLELPVPRDAEAILKDCAGGVIAVIEADIQTKAIRVNVTFEERLLARIDRAAERVGYTRSGLLSVAARDWIRRQGEGRPSVASSADTYAIKLAPIGVSDRLHTLFTTEAASVEAARMRLDAYQSCGSQSLMSSVCIVNSLCSSFGSTEELNDAGGVWSFDSGECLTRVGGRVFRQRPMRDDDELVTFSGVARRPLAVEQ